MKPNPIPALLATKRVWIENPMIPGQWTLMILQRVAPGLGNVTNYPKTALQLRRHIIPRDPRTALQQSQRARFRNAQVAWYALTPSGRADWSIKGSPFALTGRQIFTRNYIATNPAPIIPQPLRVIHAPSGQLWPLYADLWPIAHAFPHYFQLF